MAAGNALELVGLAKRAGIGNRVADAILDVVGAIPKSTEVGNEAPYARALMLGRRAS